MHKIICRYCKSELTTYELSFGEDVCLICARFGQDYKHDTFPKGGEQLMMDNPEYMNPPSSNKDFNLIEFNDSLDIISLIAWGLKNNVVFKSPSEEPINNVEQVLNTFAKEPFVYVETQNLDFVKKLQSQIQKANVHYEEEKLSS